ncbi:MAG: hypothetical protein JJ971_15665 [Balneolaceae bacterium]|nr:hypothetical protein [Balneolaceae bacterium]MBO6547838.1 hypothetical protein [Balneolaceae bacterium]MBO6648349.1 hypothetical protein [Balneolaceae bacterium]
MSDRSDNREGDIETITKMHNEQRTYHFEKMAEEFANQLSDEFISLNRGIVSQQTYEEHKSRYIQYFNSVEFQVWDDTEVPIFRFSNDNSLAYTIVQKDVVVNYQDEEGKLLRDSVHFAWLAVYRKIETGEWKIESVASTNAEPVITVQE